MNQKKSIQSTSILLPFLTEELDAKMTPPRQRLKWN